MAIPDPTSPLARVLAPIIARAYGGDDTADRVREEVRRAPVTNEELIQLNLTRTAAWMTVSVLFFAAGTILAAVGEGLDWARVEQVSGPVFAVGPATMSIAMVCLAKRTLCIKWDNDGVLSGRKMRLAKPSGLDVWIGAVVGTALVLMLAGTE